MTNCPNCGAPVQGAVCEYCGTHFEKQPQKQEAFEILINTDKLSQKEIYHALETMHNFRVCRVPMNAKIEIKEPR